MTRLGSPLPKKFSGDFVGRVTPVPIPNTEVKPAGADGTARETVWESRKSPGLLNEARSALHLSGLFPWEAVMPDYLEQFGNQVTSWNGQPMGNRQTAFFIYERDGSFTGIGLISGNYYSQTFDHLPSPAEGEQHFASDERFKRHF